MKNITIFSLLIFVIHAYPVPPQDILDDLNEANLREETPVTEEYPIGGPSLMC